MKSETSLYYKKYEGIHNLKPEKKPKISPSTVRWSAFVRRFPSAPRHGRSHSQALRRPVQVSAFRRLRCGQNLFTVSADGQRGFFAAHFYYWWVLGFLVHLQTVGFVDFMFLIWGGEASNPLHEEDTDVTNVCVCKVSYIQAELLN